MNFQFETARTKEKDLQTYKEAFDYYDWNKSGSISVKVRVAHIHSQMLLLIEFSELNAIHYLTVCMTVFKQQGIQY